MDHVTFEAASRRAATLLDRRSLFGGASAALFTIVGMPLVAEAKNKRDNLAKRCRRNLPGFCAGNQRCISELKPCCRFLAKGNREKADACCRESEFCAGAASRTEFK
jgi:hypothetical protein